MKIRHFLVSLSYIFVLLSALFGFTGLASWIEAKREAVIASELASIERKQMKL